ncbi:MAG: cytochrome c oxidase subunit II [Leptolyngbyaceae bacterium]|nr:cytochrome c oxidase subunit II [Leptolyngbyaceae bacterium]
MNIPSSIYTMLAGIILTLVSLWYGQNHGLMPQAASEEAPLVDGLFNAMMTISTGLFILVQGVILISAFKYRRRKGDDTDGPPVHGNIPLEILWTAIPAVIVLGISVYSFDIYGQMGGMNPMDHTAHLQDAQRIAQQPGAAIAAPLPPSSETTSAGMEHDHLMLAQAEDPATAAVRNESIPERDEAPAFGVTAPRIGPTPERVGKAPELVVNVTGLQYAWIFTYPDANVTSGELHVPTGREVKLNISANDVIHAFWVPEFRLKQDAIPGRQTELRFTPSKVGAYPVICAELCGAYHGVMKTRVLVEAPNDFNEWLQSQQIASQEDLSKAIAINSAPTAPAEFLAPYAEDMGIQPETIQQISTLHHAYDHSALMTPNAS